jgi:superfamily II DNA/RNA helicase
LIDEFTNNPDCKVFLSTDAGGTGLNLQAADCVVNFELPWNPAKLNQRVGRVNRIGQTSKCVNVVNLICKDSIEEKIMAGLQMKTDLFKGVFDGGEDTVMFSREKRTELLNKLRTMMGEEPVEFSPGPGPQDEIPEDAPHYLNPKALADEEKTVAYDEEETQVETELAAAQSVAATPEPPPAAAMASGGGGNGGAARAGAFQRQSPEKMEKVLDSGMQFLTGLMEMATGQKFESASDDKRMINIDEETGEVTLKFKLPGF